MLGALLLTLRLASLSVLLLFASSVLPVQYPLHHPPALPEQFKLTVAAELAEVLTDRGSGPFINMDFWYDSKLGRMRLELYFQPSLDLTFLGAPFPTPPIVILQFENGTQAVTVPELGTCTLQLFTLSWIHRDWVQDFLIKALIDDLNWVTCLQYNTSWFHSQGSTFAAEYYASYGDYMGIPVQVDVFTPSASAHRAPTLLIAGKVMKYKPGVTAPDDAYAVPNGCQEPSDGSSMLDALQQWLTLRRHGNLFAECPRTLGNMSIQNLSCLA